jgi:hypothetical protein
MQVDERARHELHDKLDELLGPERATTLMSLLPPVGWADVATKRDLDALAVATKRDLDGLRGEIQAVEAALRGEIQAVEAALRGEMQALEASLRGEMQTSDASLKGELATTRAEFHRELGLLTRTLMIGMVTSMVAVSSLAFGAARLL